MREFNLMEDYPKTERDIKKRLKEKTPEMIKVCRKFDWEYFDRYNFCYNCYSYDGRWIKTCERAIKEYNLKPNSKILDIGCAKGYMVYDFVNLGMDAIGIDISTYALGCSPTEIRHRLFFRDVRDLSIYKDNEFDFVFVNNVIENISEEECLESVREIERIGKNKFIRVDAYSNEVEKTKLFNWCITPKCIFHKNKWKSLFEEAKYTGDYYWFTP